MTECINSNGEENFIVLDGGLGTELTRAGFKIDDDPLWSTRTLIENSEAVKAVHKSFLESGADIVITGTYQLSLKTLCQHCDFDENKALDVIYSSVKIAQEACLEVKSNNSEYKRRLLVAGSVGPYGACQHDWSEYSGNYVDNMTIKQLMDWHRPRVKALLEAGVDILALETIPAQKEAEALIQLLKEFPTAKAWLCFSCKDERHTCHGELFSEVVTKTVCQSAQIVAVGVNCSPPQFVKFLLQSIQGKVDLPLIVYPNGFDDGKFVWDDDEHQVLSGHVMEWIAAGARWIGGCCGTQSKDIAKIRKIVESIG